MIREMMIHDYEQMIHLWKEIDGLALSEADSKTNIERYLNRNKGLSYVFEVEGSILSSTLPFYPLLEVWVDYADVVKRLIHDSAAAKRQRHQHETEQLDNRLQLT